MHVVDASVWISRFVPTDVHYQSSHKWLGNQVALNDVVVSPAILLAEVGGAIAIRTGNSELGMIVVGLMQRFPNVRLVPVDASLAALSAQLAVTLRLLGADSLYVATALRLGVPLITWDREQRDRSVTSVSAFTPEESLR